MYVSADRVIDQPVYRPAGQPAGQPAGYPIGRYSTSGLMQCQASAKSVSRSTLAGPSWQSIPVEGRLFILPFSSPLTDRRDPKRDGGGDPGAFANRGWQGRANWR